jgi:hypothetical protein
MQVGFPIENRANLSSEIFARIAAAVSSHSSIKHALDWMRSHDPPFAPTAMVTQDEFSHDILVAYSSKLWLVYSTT